jgi:hypothetical protein
MHPISTDCPVCGTSIADRNHARWRSETKMDQTETEMEIGSDRTECGERERKVARSGPERKRFRYATALFGDYCSWDTALYRTVASRIVSQIRSADSSRPLRSALGHALRSIGGLHLQRAVAKRR